jgi:hypothetical protein
VNSGWVRIVIIAAAVVTGALVIANGFDSTIGAVGGEEQPTTTAPTQTPSRSPSPRETTRSPAPPRDCVRETQVAVYNATEVTGLAAAAAERITQAGYIVDDEHVLNAESETATSEVLFRTQADRADAECLAARLLQGLDAIVGPLEENTNIPAQVRVAVIVGSDYAAQFPVE